MIEKTFLNPATNKQWRIEIDGHTIRTCLNGGKVKEILCDSAFQVRSKAASAMMGQMRKGFVYQNPDAAVGQARCHRFVGKDSNGFMPLAAALTRDDFFLTRVVGDFEDETLYHFDGSGEILETVSLGAKRMTYEQVLCPNDTLLLNNSYLLQQFSLRTHEITPFANKKNSMKAMLDASGDLALWYTGEEIVVFDFGSNTEVWRETVKCKKSKDPNFAYYCFGMLSPRQSKAAYRVTEGEYVLVDLKSAQKVVIPNEGWHPFFSPDDQCFSVGGRFYLTQTGEETANPFPFAVPQGLNFSDTCIVRGDLKLMDDGRLRFEKLANNDNDIKVGEQVVTSYVSDRFVQGLFIGYISEINVDSNYLTRSGYITPAVDFSKIQEVLVLTKTKEDMTNGADDESASDTAKGE